METFEKNYDSKIIIVYQFLVEKSRKAKEECDAFYKDHSEDIDAWVWDEKRKDILKILPKALKKGCVVWCRHGGINPEATLCSKTKHCKYKKHQEDIIDGCSRCQHFAVTTKTDTWENAYLINIEELKEAKE